MHKVCRNEKERYFSIWFSSCVFNIHSRVITKQISEIVLITINIYLLHLLLLVWLARRIPGVTIIYTFAARKTDEPSACHQPFWIFSFVFQHNRKSRSTIIESLGSFFNASIELSPSPNYSQSKSVMLLARD